MLPQAALSGSERADRVRPAGADQPGRTHYGIGGVMKTSLAEPTVARADQAQPVTDWLGSVRRALSATCCCSRAGCIARRGAWQPTGQLRKIWSRRQSPERVRHWARLSWAPP